MSRRIAHRPRYYSTRPLPYSPHHSSKDYLRTRWTYRRQQAFYARCTPGQSLRLIPWGYKLLRSALLRP
jgi:hypothetical protein